MKSNIAAKAVKAINPNINIHTFVDSVELKNDHIYNEIFFKQLDGIVAALKNTRTRKFLPINLREIKSF
jgi:molybdopterin/thiamine biosynthesis adenylyltransferase